MGLIRRSRTYPKQTTGIVRKTKNDAFGFLHALARYGQLPSSYLVGLDDRYPARAADRLTRYFQETEKWPVKDKPIIRLDNWRQHGWNSQALYKAGAALIDFLREYGVFTEQQLDLIPKTKIGNHHDPHNNFLNCFVADIEIACEKAGLRFINHLELLKSPLSIPVGSISIPGHIPTKETTLEPDALFAIEYPEGIRFFFVEYDMGTENIESKDLKHRSWLRKVLAYNAASKGAMKELIGTNTFYVLVPHPFPRKHGKIENAIRRVFQNGSPMFCLMPHAPMGLTQLLPKPTDHYFTGEWQRVGHPPLKLSEV